MNRGKRNLLIFIKIYYMKKLLLALGFIAVTSFQVQAQDDRVKEVMGEEGVAQLLAMLGTQAEVKPSYTFPVSMKMQIKTFKNGVPSDAADMNIYVNNEQHTFATKLTNNKEAADLFMIYNHESGDMLMLNDKEKTVTAFNADGIMKSDMIKQAMGEGSKDAANTTCNKTGKTKVINGFKCEEYVCENKEKQGRYEMWVTNEIKVDFLKGMKDNPLTSYFSNVENLGGMMLQGDFYEYGKQQAHIDVSDVNQKANYSVKTTGYKRVGM